MRAFIKDFFKRGIIAFGFGPIIMSIVYLCLTWAGISDSLTIAEVAKQVLLVSLMAFLAGGIPAIYQIEKLPLPLAIFIQAFILYLDYIIIYLINGWLTKSLMPIIIFTVAFLVGFAIVWGIVYLFTRNATKKLNEQLND